MRCLIAALVLAQLGAPALATETCYPEDGSRRLAGTYSIFERTAPNQAKVHLVEVATGQSHAGGLIWCHLEGHRLMRIEETGPNGLRAFYRDGPVWSSEESSKTEKQGCALGQGPCTVRERDWQGQFIRTYSRTCASKDGEMWYRRELTQLRHQDWSTGVRTNLPNAWRERELLWQLFDDEGRLIEEHQSAWRSDDLTAVAPIELPLRQSLTRVSSGPVSDLPCFVNPEACDQSDGLVLCKQISTPLLADP